MKQPSRRQVSLRNVDFEKATALRDEITEKSGRKITISDTVARALVLPKGRARAGRLALAERSRASP